MLIGRRILVVDDEQVLARNLDHYFSKRLAEVQLAASGEAAVAMAWGFQPDVAVAADRLPGMDGIETLRALRAEMPSLCCILMTDRSDGAVREEAYASGITRILDKPFALAALLNLIAEPYGEHAGRGTAADLRGADDVLAVPPPAGVHAHAPGPSLHHSAWALPRPIGSRIFLHPARG